jgi:hypothetical protein
VADAQTVTGRGKHKRPSTRSQKPHLAEISKTGGGARGTFNGSVQMARRSHPPSRDSRGNVPFRQAE